MTDLELTRLCAEAVGITLNKGLEANPSWDWETWVPWCEDEESGEDYWPLKNDAQAMMLVKKFRLNIGAIADSWKVFYMSKTHVFDADGDDLNRAVCECCARMQLEKSK